MQAFPDTAAHTSVAVQLMRIWFRSVVDDGRRHALKHMTMVSSCTFFLSEACIQLSMIVLNCTTGAWISVAGQLLLDQLWRDLACCVCGDHIACYTYEPAHKQYNTHVQCCLLRVRHSGCGLFETNYSSKLQQ